MRGASATLATLATLGAFVLMSTAGCSASPVTQCYRAAGSYEVAQIVIEGAVLNPSVTPNQKATLQAIDREAVAASHACRDAAVASDDNDVAFYTGVLAGAALQARGLLDE